MSKQEIKSEINEILEYIEINGHSMDEKELKSKKRQVRKLKKNLIALTPELTPGTEISLEDFIIRINNSAKNERPMKKFFKENAYRLNNEEQDILKDMLKYEYGAFAYFNRNYTPTDVKRIKGEVKRKEVESSSIYAKMCAPETTKFRDEFKIVVQYNQEPITVFKEYTKNTTLSQSEVRAFM